MSPEPARDAVLTTPATLANNLEDPTVQPIEVDVDTTLYEKGHIPGAAGWNWETDLQHPIRRDVAERSTIKTLLQEAGVSPETTLVLYGDNHNWFAAYAYWLLLYHGFPHDQLRLLDGGRSAWTRNGYEFTNEGPEPTDETPELGPTRDGIRATREDAIQAAESNNGPPLVDVRSPEEFEGEIIAPPDLDETAQRGGHIPGASNVSWSQAVNDDGTFRSNDELAQLYQNAGITPEEETIVYCRIGERSSHSWFVLTQLLDWPATNYDGSWTEYGNLIDVPIATGPANA